MRNFQNCCKCQQIKKELDLFYLLYSLKILSLDLFAEIHESCVKFSKPRSQISIDMRFTESYLVQVLVKINRSLGGAYG